MSAGNGPAEIDRAAHIFKIQRAAHAADACVATDKADGDFAGDGVSRELAADLSDLQAARQVRGAHPAADHAGLDMGTVFDFEMSADDARDEWRMHAGQVCAAGDLFDRHFAVNRAAIESAGDVAEGDRTSGFNRERAADFHAVDRTGFLD